MRCVACLSLGLSVFVSVSLALALVPLVVISTSAAQFFLSPPPLRLFFLVMVDTAATTMTLVARFQGAALLCSLPLSRHVVSFLTCLCLTFVLVLRSAPVTACPCL